MQGHSKVNACQHNKNQQDFFESIKERIKKIPPSKQRYRYDGEESINPAYVNIENSSYLCPNEKRIFVLRSDFILATGIKNVCVDEGNIDIFQVTDSSVHHYINKKDRYGHPSLAKADGNYDGSVYYAGWLCQRQNHIKIFLQSGRFHNSNLTELEKMDIELYIADQFMKYYGKQDILFYDCNENEKLTLFLSDQMPKDKIYRIYTSSIMDSVLSNKNCDKLFNYENKMESGKNNLSLSLKRLGNDEEFIKAINPKHVNTIKKLGLVKADNDSEIFNFDTIWNEIKNIFDLAMYHSYNKNTSLIATNKFKNVIKMFTDAGIPFVEGKKLVVWSTRFARDEAIRFAIANNAVTDGMAQKYIRNILLGWPDGQLNVFYDLVKTPEPLFYEMSTIFWNAMSEFFISEMKPGSEVHFFYQDSLTLGNFCWESELPIIRNKNGKIMLHQYDLSTHSWNSPVDMDSPASDGIFLRRRALHSFDINNPQLNFSHVKNENGVKIWKQEFKNHDMTKELTEWHSPKCITLGQMRFFINKWKKNINNTESPCSISPSVNST